MLQSHYQEACIIFTTILKTTSSEGFFAGLQTRSWYSVAFSAMLEIPMASVPGGFVSMAYIGSSKGLLKKCLEAGVVLVLTVDGTVIVPMHSGLKSLTEQLCVTISPGPKAGFLCDF